MPTIPGSISTVRSRLESDESSSNLKGFSKSIRISLTDLNESFLFALNDGKLVGFESGNVSKADVTILLTDQLLNRILEKKANPMSSFMAGDLQAKGSLEDLMRLQKLLS